MKRTRPLDMRSPYNLSEVGVYLSVYYQFLFAPILVVVFVISLIAHNPYHLFFGLCAASVPLLFVTYRKIPFLYIAHMASMGIWIIIIYSTWNYFYPAEMETPSGTIMVPESIRTQLKMHVQLPSGYHSLQSIDQTNVDWPNFDQNRVALISLPQEDDTTYYYPVVISNGQYFIILPEHAQFTLLADTDIYKNTFYLKNFAGMKEQPMQSSYKILQEKLKN